MEVVVTNAAIRRAKLHQQQTSMQLDSKLDAIGN